MTRNITSWGACSGAVVLLLVACGNGSPEEEFVAEAAQAVNVCNTTPAANLIVDGIPAYAQCGTSTNSAIYSNNGVDTATSAVSSEWKRTQYSGGYQCTELVHRYWLFKWNVTWIPNGDAGTWCNATPPSTSGIVQTRTPVHGDAIVFSPGSCGADAVTGHIALVDVVDTAASKVTFVEENNAGRRSCAWSCAACFLHVVANAGSGGSSGVGGSTSTAGGSMATGGSATNGGIAATVGGRSSSGGTSTSNGGLTSTTGGNTKASGGLTSTSDGSVANAGGLTSTSGGSFANAGGRAATGGATAFTKGGSSATNGGSATGGVSQSSGKGGTENGGSGPTAISGGTAPMTTSSATTLAPPAATGGTTTSLAATLTTQVTPLAASDTAADPGCSCRIQSASYTNRGATLLGLVLVALLRFRGSPTRKLR